jgi:hypothetical protein
MNRIITNEKTKNLCKTKKEKKVIKQRTKARWKDD